MAEGWKQVWEDIVNSLRGEPKQVIPPSESVEPSQDTSKAIQAEEAAYAVDAVVSTVDQTVTEQTLNLSSSETQRIEPVSEVETVSEPVDAEIAVEPTKIEPTQTGWFTKILPLVGIAALLTLWVIGNNSVSRPQAPAPNVIATFDGGQITIEDVEAHLALLMHNELQDALHSTDSLVRVIEDLVTDQLALRWSANRQPDRDEEFQHTMEHITEELNLSSLDTQLHTDDIPVSESEIQDYYNVNRNQFGDQPVTAVRDQIRQILVSEREQDYVENYIQQLKDDASVTRTFELLMIPIPTEDDLQLYYDANRNQFAISRQAIVTELRFPIDGDETTAQQNADNALLSIRSGASLEAVSQNYSTASFVSNTTVPEALREPEWDTVVFSLTVGEMSGVFRAGTAYYIIRLEGIQDARIQTLDEVRDPILEIVTQQQTNEWFGSNANRTLFTIEGRQYTVGEFYQEYQELSPITHAQYAGPDGMQQLAERLIERLLLVEDTNEQLMNVQNQPLTDEARLQVIKQMMHQEEVDDVITVTETEMQQFYNDNIELMMRPSQSRIRYIRIGLGSSEDETQRARERADEAYRRLVPALGQIGEDFAVIAQEYSEDAETAANGGEFPGWIGESPDILTEMEMHSFHESISTLQTGEISPVFEYGDSLYIVQIIERTEPETLTFEQVGPSIEEILRQQKHEEISAQLQLRLLEEANFVIYEDVVVAYLEEREASLFETSQP